MPISMGEGFLSEVSIRSLSEGFCVQLLADKIGKCSRLPVLVGVIPTCLKDKARSHFGWTSSAVVWRP